MAMKTGYLLLSAFLLCCSSPTEPEWIRRPATIAFDDGRSIVPYTELDVPDTVDAGTLFEARFATYAPDLCVQMDEVVVSHSGLEATISPYDLYPAPRMDIDCLDQIQHFERSTKLRFATRGTATIRLDGGGPGSSGRATIERIVVVR